MDFTEIDIYNLEEIFIKRYKELSLTPEALKNDDFYIDWCDKHNIVMLHDDWMKETLNEGKMKGRVCIMNPEGAFMTDVSNWLLVTKKFAIKSLVLGCLP